MPYRCDGADLMHKKGGTWKVKQHCKSEKNCKAAMRLLYGVEHGMTPKKRSSGKSELEKAMS